MIEQYTAGALCLAGLSCLVVGAVQIHQIIRAIRQAWRWRLMLLLIAVFFTGYIVFGLHCLGSLGIETSWPAVDINAMIGLVFALGGLFVMIASRTALATVRDLTQLDTLRALSITDELTRLHNRRYGELRLAEEWSRSRRYRHALAVIMLDIDHFKHINDSAGHEAGDRVLQAVARVLRTELRSCDVACRWGGEEFLLILPETSASQAMVAADRVRRAISAQVCWAMPAHGSTDAPSAPQRFTITVSLGTSGPDGRADSHPRDWLAAADAALYRAKRAGRDRAELARREDYPSEKPRDAAPAAPLLPETSAALFS